jgi:flagellar biosynthesis component FlhA
MKIRMMLFAPGVVLFIIGTLTLFTQGNVLSIPNLVLIVLGLSLAGVSLMKNTQQGAQNNIKKKEQAKSSSFESKDQGKEEEEEEDSKQPNDREELLQAQSKA